MCTGKLLENRQFEQNVGEIRVSIKRNLCGKATSELRH